MPQTITFTAINSLPADPNQNLLLFLMPKNSAENYQVEAWQKLNPGPNNGQSTIQFAFDETFVASTDVGPNQTAATAISPGQVLGVYSDGVSALSVKSSPDDANRVTSTQAGLVNRTNSLLITAEWSINGNPVVRVPPINQGQIVTFEFEPTIYVMAAAPTLIGKVGSFSFTVQEVSALTKYTIPPGCTNVTMTWSRAGNNMGGTDLFTFDPACYYPAS